MGNVTYYYGPPRSCKTIRMVMQAVSDYCDGRQILSNIKSLKLPQRYVRLSHLIEMISKLPDNRKYSLFLQEIQTEADSRNAFREENKAFSYFVAQCGKRDIKINYDGQFVGGAELRLRQITDTITRCEAIRDTTGNLRGAMYYVFDKMTGKSWKYFVDAVTLSAFYDFYNTREIVLPEEYELILNQEVKAE